VLVWTLDILKIGSDAADVYAKGVQEAVHDLLRAREESEMDELQAGVEFALSVFPETSAFSIQANDRSATPRWGMTAKVCNSLLKRARLIHCA